MGLRKTLNGATRQWHAATTPRPDFGFHFQVPNGGTCPFLDALANLALRDILP